MPRKVYIRKPRGNYNGKSINQRFWEKVEKTENCWIWKGISDKKGYGRIQYLSKSWTAHRLSYFLIYGEIPKGLIVCHHCDNPPCVKPDHLFIGTYSDNMQDMIKKGRNRLRNRGKWNRGGSRLTDEQVKEIRRLYVLRVTSSSYLAKKFEVHRSTIGDIIRRKTWKHIN